MYWFRFYMFNCTTVFLHIKKWRWQKYKKVLIFLIILKNDAIIKLNFWFYVLNVFNVYLFLFTTKTNNFYLKIFIIQLNEHTLAH